MYFGEMLKLPESSLLIRSSSFLFPKYPEFLNSFFPSRSKSDGENSVREESGRGTLIVQATPRKAMCELHESSLSKEY